MRLLFVHERLGAFGGAESNLQAAARELKNRGHSLGLLHGPATGQEEAAWHGIFPASFSLKNPHSDSSTQTAITDFKPEVVYVHKMADLKVLQRLVASGLPLVRMVHDHDLYCMRSYKYNWLTRAICRRPASRYCVFGCGASVARNRGGGLPLKWVSYRRKRKESQLNHRFHRMIVGSNYMRQELLQNGFDDKKIEIHPPVPPNLAEKPLNHEVGSSFSDRNLVLYVGQIIRGKGVDVLLQSLTQVHAPFECLILGDGNHRPFCEKLSRRLGLEKRVQFLGFISQDGLRDYFSQASVMVLSSVWPEPFGAAGLEGMRYGLPVVAFDAGAIREWLLSSYNGFLVPWMDRIQFAARIQELLLNKTRARELGERGARLVSQRFAFSDYISSLESTFDRVRSEAGPATPCANRGGSLC